MRIRLYIASLLLLGVFNVQAQYTTEVFATNVDGAGTDLRWYVYTPTTGGPPWPAVVYAQGGGYNEDLHNTEQLFGDPAMPIFAAPNTRAGATALEAGRF